MFRSIVDEESEMEVGFPYVLVNLIINMMRWICTENTIDRIQFENMQIDWRKKKNIEWMKNMRNVKRADGEEKIGQKEMRLIPFE